MKITLGYNFGRDDDEFVYEADADVSKYLQDYYGSLTDAIDDLVDDDKDKDDINTWEDLEEYCVDGDILDNNDNFYDWCHDYFEDDARESYNDSLESPDGFDSDYDFHRWINR